MPTSSPRKPGELINELLTGMHVSGVQYRKIVMAGTPGLGFSNSAGRAQFHFVGRGPVWLRSPGGALHELNTGDAALIPRGGAHAVLSSASVAARDVITFEPAACCGWTAHPADASHALIFSACMEFDLGGMQPLIAAMPEILLVSTLMAALPELQPMLDAMERETLKAQAGYAGILARLAEVVAALIVRGWVASGCGEATGWIGALQDPRLSTAIVLMHQVPGRNWTVAELAKEAGSSRSVFARRFLAATGVSPLRYLTDLRMRLAFNRLSREGQPVEAVAIELGYGSLAAFSRAFKRNLGISPGAVRASRSQLSAATPFPFPPDRLDDMR
ncbi:AraC family transcriptional regulator [[Erwinia] mediterraneensis]|uniref:AraC family transcriptional regulator n=1 Tax=[Erwinia] mediterraneensis TaxID=2161819 RepID=UPI0010306900|nr:AraC family transcriptional regulator [[Erwinia] mediterraneensis]